MPSGSWRCWALRRPTALPDWWGRIRCPTGRSRRRAWPRQSSRLRKCPTSPRNYSLDASPPLGCRATGRMPDHRGSRCWRSSRSCHWASFLLKRAGRAEADLADGGVDIETARRKRRVEVVLYSHTAGAGRQGRQNVGGHGDLSVACLDQASITEGDGWCRGGCLGGGNAGDVNVGACVSTRPSYLEILAAVDGGGYVRIGPAQKRVREVEHGGEGANVRAAASLEGESSARLRNRRRAEGFARHALDS